MLGFIRVDKANPNHMPAGSSKGGQFAPKKGGASGGSAPEPPPSRFFRGDLSSASSEDVFAGSSKEIQDLAVKSGVLATDDASHAYAKHMESLQDARPNKDFIAAVNRLKEIRESDTEMGTFYDILKSDMGIEFPDEVKVSLQAKMLILDQAQGPRAKEVFSLYDPVAADLTLAMDTEMLRRIVRDIPKRDMDEAIEEYKSRPGASAKGERRLEAMRKGDFSDMTPLDFGLTANSLPSINKYFYHAFMHLEDTYTTDQGGGAPGMPMNDLAALGRKLITSQMEAKLATYRPGGPLTHGVLVERSKQIIEKATVKKLESEGVKIHPDWAEDLREISGAAMWDIMSKIKNLDDIGDPPKSPVCLSAVDAPTKARLSQKLLDDHDMREHRSFRIEPKEIFQIIPSKAVRERYRDVADQLDNEMDELYHGTHEVAATHIGGGGFLVPKEAKVGRMFGNGVYLADKSSKSAQYFGDEFSRSDADGVLLLSKASLGRVKTVTRSFNPDSEDPRHAWISYDTLQGEPGRGLKNREWAVHDPGGVLPRYYITASRRRV